MSAAATLITGTGVVSCAGLGVEALWKQCLKGESAINEGLGRVNYDEVHEAARELNPHLARHRALAMALVAASEAMSRAGWTRLNPDDGLILATTTGQIHRWDQEMLKYLEGSVGEEALREAFRHQALGSLLTELSTALDFRGRSLLVTSACCAATQALGLARSWVRRGEVKRCLVAGVETLCDLTVEGFRSLQLLSNEPARPFDAKRDGINLSEGAAFLCLEANGPESRSRARTVLSGAGFGSDAYHMTAPHPEGRGTVSALECALKTSGLAPSEISWIHAHGTGSRHNDVAEARAIGHVLGSARVPVSSTKHIHGHALGASGAIESVLCVEALERQCLLPNSGLNEMDPEIQINAPREAIAKPLKHVLKNTLGFGGINAALIFSRANWDGN